MPVPFSKPPRAAGYQDKQKGRMPKRMRGKSTENKKTSVGTEPTPAPPVDGSVVTHDRDY